MKLHLAGADIQYQSRGHGSGLPLLFLHAFPLDSRMWDESVAALSGTHLCLRFDARGFGGSSRADGLLTMERIADDAVALLDHLGIPSAVVCGCSMGGYAAFAFVRRHRERLRGLILADTRAAADNDEQRAGRHALAERVRQEGPTPAAEAFLPKLLGETSQRKRPALVRHVREMILEQDKRGISDALGGLASRSDSTGTLREIEVPTLVLAGEEDVISPPAEAEAMAKALGRSPATTIPEAGHLAVLENPAAFNAAVTAFLGEMH